MIKLTKHATEAMQARRIEMAWIEATLSRPDWVTPDPHRPERARAYKTFAELDGGVLRVVYRQDGADMVVITVHPDRSAKP